MLDIAKPARHFLPESFNLETWEDVKPFYEQLESRPLESKDALVDWLKDASELEAILEEDAAWRYIKMTIDTRDEGRAAAYQKFIGEIQPPMAPWGDKLNKKLNACAFAKEFTDEAHQIMLRKVDKAIAIFRDENIALQKDAQQLAQEYSTTTAGMSVEIDGEKLTMPAAGALLQSPDRDKRKTVFEAVNAERLAARESLDHIFEQLVSKRHEMAINADYPNYRDFSFDRLSRFDYTPEDCFAFHESIKEAILPITKTFLEERKANLKLETLKPWDLSVDPSGKKALKPFTDGEDLLKKSIEVFSRVKPYFGECLETMHKMGHLDLESKDGKAPGGYNYPLYEIGVPFIFMNAVGTQRDMVTMMHEGGHAVHSFLSRDLALSSFKNCPSEVAELASMAMELLTIDHWDVFYSDAEELKRAKKDHLQDLLGVLPWIATIDKFQHWLYENPTHTAAERTENWNRISGDLSSDIVDWTGHEESKACQWQRQLHLFEVPFYYIEYGMAQLGAIAVWRNYKNNPEKAVQQYEDALKLGYTKSIGGIYEAAGIKFDFSKEYVQELADFVKAEIAGL